MKRKAGFTLLEAMIVVAIVAILAMVAIPSYRNHMCSSRRTDGKIALMQAAQIMERYFTNNNTYVGATISDAAGATIRATSENGYYTLSFPAAATPTAFTIRAVAQGDQLADDAACRTLTINQQGVKGQAIAPPPACW